eukprot:CAMPEP_0201554712 /NCGR_PEP_ID=MMETSP0173_2-20130828/43530_1 /ASSEMBLY_ACC=CAM_ASM_000268 /TAXON_ID=218659 /ORGANISM="Vexillifera sp., Strain DIVA3 564/2" /LENGTH=79 /DNA_ID=CAMNT_0047966133 /DNA_START=1274 /DNA_END=1513 /DNA_ORIENTATION=-
MIDQVIDWQPIDDNSNNENYVCLHLKILNTKIILFSIEKIDGRHDQVVEGPNIDVTKANMIWDDEEEGLQEIQVLLVPI